MTESIAASCEAIDEQIGRLARGLLTNDAASALRAYRVLYRMGPTVIPVIKDVAFRAKWPDTCRHDEVRYITGLVSLVHDLDEQESRSLVENLARRGCGHVVERALRVATKPRIADYKEFMCRGVRVLLHHDLPSTFGAERRVSQWLGVVPAQDLEDIEMIFVTPHGPEDRSGDYVPSLCSIRVIWPDLGVRIPGLARLSSLDAERTLYHEIGHHVHRHTFGLNPEQEKEADRYADACNKRSHPLLFRIVAPLVRPVATVVSAVARHARQ